MNRTLRGEDAQQAVAGTVRTPMDHVYVGARSGSMNETLGTSGHQRPRINGFTWLCLIGLFVVATAMNLTKAYHIDDAFHLAAAQWIAQHPLEPMSGTINWSGWDQYFHEGNQPPLFFYGMALWGAGFGYGAVAMHAFEALFTAMAIFFFHGIARMLAPRLALYLTALLALGPAFIVNQNVMLDIPLLGMLCGFLYFAGRALQKPAVGPLLRGALFLSVGVLTKYTMLAMLPAFGLVVWYCGKRFWWIVLVPITVLFAWSIWNVFEFGSVHVLGRSTDPPGADGWGVRLLSWIMTLGAIAPWLYFTGIWSLPVASRKSLIAAWTGFLCVAAFVIAAWLGAFSQSLTDGGLLVAFCLNGAVGLLAALVVPLKNGSAIADPITRIRNVLLVAFLLLSVFVIAVAPWMATRHLLLVLPIILLLTSSALERTPIALRIAALASTAVLGIALGISDRRFAAFYRDSASAIVSRYGSGHSWYTGSMGWGWYAQQNGMQHLKPNGPQPAVGDIIAMPLDFSVPPIPEVLKTTEVDLLQQPINAFDRFSTRHWLRFYSARYPDAPWGVTLAQEERIGLSRIEP